MLTISCCNRVRAGSEVDVPGYRLRPQTSPPQVKPFPDLSTPRDFRTPHKTAGPVDKPGEWHVHAVEQRCHAAPECRQHCWATCDSSTFGDAQDCARLAASCSKRKRCRFTTMFKHILLHLAKLMFATSSPPPCRSVPALPCQQASGWHPQVVAGEGEPATASSQLLLRLRRHLAA